MCENPCFFSDLFDASIKVHEKMYKSIQILIVIFYCANTIESWFDCPEMTPMPDFEIDKVKMQMKENQTSFIICRWQKKQQKNHLIQQYTQQIADFVIFQI